MRHWTLSRSHASKSKEKLLSQLSAVPYNMKSFTNIDQTHTSYKNFYAHKNISPRGIEVIGVMFIQQMDISSHFISSEIT
jgi:hypothetical protein